MIRAPMQALLPALTLIVADLSFIPAARAAGEACETISDVRSRHPALKDFFSTPRDQDSSWWCAMFMTADLLTFRLGKPVSALDLAVTFNYESLEEKPNFTRYAFTEKKISQQNWGHIGGLLGAAKKHGACLEADMPSNSNAFADEAHSIIRAIQQIELLHRRIKKEKLTLERFLKDPTCMGTIGKFLPGVAPKDLYKAISDAWPWEHPDVIFFKLDQLSCKGRRLDVPKTTKATFLDSQKKARDELVRALESILKRGQPVAATFPYSFLSAEKSDATHGAVLLAQEMRDGQCKLLLRSSWGPGCAYYRYPIMRDCNAREGVVWVSRDELLKQPAMQLQYLE